MTLSEKKTIFRKTVRNRLRENAPDRNRKSAAIWRRLDEIEAFRNAVKENKLMSYLDFDHEVETTRFLTPILNGPAAGDSGSKIVIPHCEKNEIIPYLLFSLNELAPGGFGILELEERCRQSFHHQVSPKDISAVLVPGLAFDLHGNRLGRGKGFYDRFLATLPESTITIGLAFECQVFEQVPVGPDDRPVSMLVTEDRILP